MCIIYTTTTTMEPLEPGTEVLIQNSGKWNRYGKILECLPFRQYRVRMCGSGRITLRNRRFLKRTLVTRNSTLLPLSTNNDPVTPAQNLHSEGTGNDTLAEPNLNDSNTPSEPETPNLIPEASRETIPKAIRDLEAYNKPGLKEGPSELPSRLRPRN